MLNELPQTVQGSCQPRLAAQASRNGFAQPAPAFSGPQPGR